MYQKLLGGCLADPQIMCLNDSSRYNIFSGFVLCDVLVQNALCLPVGLDICGKRQCEYHGLYLVLVPDLWLQLCRTRKRLRR